MRVLHVIHSLDSASGGPSGALRMLVEEQVRRGLCVGVLCTDVQSREPWIDAGEFRRGLRRDRALQGAGLFVARGHGRRGWARRWRFSPQAAAVLRQAVGGGRADVVHVHGCFSHVTHAAMAEALRHGVPLVVRPAGGLLPYSMAFRSSMAKSLLFRWSLRGMMARAGALHTTSEAEAECLAGLFPGREVVAIPHGVRIPDTLDEHPGVGAPYLLFLSRLHRKKRPALLLEAWRALRAQHPGLRLVFAGEDCGELAALRAASGGDALVEFRGHVSGAEKRALLAGAAALVLPSESENFGVVVAEALAHGTPVVISEGVQIATLVRGCGAVRVFDGGAAECAAAIGEVLAADRARLGAEALEFACGNLSIGRCADQLDALYGRLLSGAAGAP